MPYKDYYKILGISRTASNDEIIKAFRRRAKETHPDVNQDTPKAESTARFQEVGEAYQALSNPDAKKRYDPIYDQEQAFRREQTTPRTTTATPSPKTERAYQGFYTDFESIFRQSNSIFDEMLKNSGLGNFTTAYNPFAPTPEALAKAERMKKELEAKERARIQKEKKEEATRREKVFNTPINISENDRLLVAALARLYKEKNLTGLEVLDENGKVLYEVTADYAYGNRALDIRRSLCDRISEPRMLNVSDWSQVMRGKEISPQDLFNFPALEKLSNDNKGLFPENVTVYLGNLRRVARFLAKPEGSLPDSISLDIRSINISNKDETNSVSLREITSGLDLGRLREIKPMAPEGQSFASRL